ncbi:acyl-CoA dehydrogenase family protein [Arhodomonas sp. AD133]|uniref:acyl-CoA dehydrogenase family protein n=1 Tax=Arhodomonas sp. AD133 TaxID=3415009 RepID=UPI003EB71BF0
MDFQLSDTHRALYRDILTFCEEELPGSDEGEPFYSRDQWRACGRAGLLGLSAPTEFGGGGHGALGAAVAMEAFGRGCSDMGLVFGAAAHLFACVMPIVEFASQPVRERVLPKLCSGEWIGANAITEEQAGSDVTALATRVTATGDDGYALSGHKSFVTNGPVADLLVTYATTNPSFGALGITGFVVETDRPGVRRSAPFAKMGLRNCPAGTVEFDECVVPASHRIGDEGQGRVVFQRSMGWERACLFGAFVGLMDRQLDRCIAHAGERRQFGQRLSSYQAVSHRIANMKLRLEGARLLLYRACWALDQGESAELPVALAKLAVSEAAVQSGLDAVQIFGGWGYQEEPGIESMLRDAVPTALFSGTSEMLREIVAQELSL